MVLIDISHYQDTVGPINWQSVLPTVDGVYVKATEGTGYVNPTWTAAYSSVARLRPMGAYHFADGADPVAEANHFCDQYTQQSGWLLRPVLDVEVPGITNGWITAWRQQVRARTGHPFIRVYANVNTLTNILPPGGWIDAQTDIWAAQYAPQLSFSHPQLVLWQNTSSATIPGILGSVDESQFLNGWTPARDAAEHGAPVPTPPAPAPGKLPPGTVLRQGSTGWEVKVLQTALNTQYPLYSHLVVDGDFGPKTRAVVVEFQTRAHIQVDGIAGPQTLGRLGLI